MNLDNPHYHEIKSLQGILAELETMKPLTIEPRSSSKEHDHEAWMKKYNHLQDMAKTATHIALMTLPEDVAEVYNAILTRKSALILGTPGK